MKGNGKYYQNTTSTSLEKIYSNFNLTLIYFNLTLIYSNFNLTSI